MNRRGSRGVATVGRHITDPSFFRFVTEGQFLLSNVTAIQLYVFHATTLHGVSSTVNDKVRRHLYAKP